MPPVPLMVLANARLPLPVAVSVLAPRLTVPPKASRPAVELKVWAALRVRLRLTLAPLALLLTIPPEPRVMALPPMVVATAGVELKVMLFSERLERLLLLVVLLLVE